MGESDNNSIFLKLPNVSLEGDEIACSESAFLPFEMADEQEEPKEDEERHHRPVQKGSPNDLQHLYTFLKQLTPVTRPNNLRPRETIPRSRPRPTLQRHEGNNKSVKNAFSEDADLFSLTDYGTSHPVSEFGFEDDYNRCQKVKRETLKISSINLYQSILPSSFFRGRRRQK